MEDLQEVRWEPTRVDADVAADPLRARRLSATGERVPGAVPEATSPGSISIGPAPSFHLLWNTDGRLVPVAGGVGVAVALPPALAPLGAAIVALFAMRFIGGWIRDRAAERGLLRPAGGAVLA
jgi:hypothetical protein